MNYQTLQNLVAQSEQQGDLTVWLEAIPELVALKTTQQDPFYHGEGDVWTHTQLVIEALLTQTDYQQASEDERLVLFMTALLHDIAKPETTVIDPITGKIGQPGHSRRGAINSRILLWRMAMPFQLREQICRIINVHQLPFYALAEVREDRTPEFLLHKLSWELPVWMLCAIAKADMQGRICADKQKVLDDIELFKTLAEEQACLYQAKYFADDYTRIQYFRGANVLPDYSLYEQQGSEVIMMAGLPASGKNHWLAKHYPNLPVASYDDARAELGLAYGKNEGAVAHLVLDKVRGWLRAKQPFVWNATHLSREVRQKALDLLYAYHAKVRIVYLEQPEKELYKRNTARDTSLRNKKIQSMFYKWEVPLPTEAHQVDYLVS